MSPTKSTQKSARNSSASGKTAKGFTSEEKAAMKERAKELKAAANQADEASAVLEKIAELPEADRALAKRLHALIKASAPDLAPKLWYGMPAYYKDGKMICFFQSAHKFKTRYATLGFSDAAKLDEGGLWPVAYALAALTAAEEAKVSALLKQALS